MITQKQRSKQLENIECAMLMAKSLYSPVFPFVSIGLMAGAIGGAVWYRAYPAQFDFLSALAISLCCGAAGYWLTKYKKQDVYIYAKLAEYEPLDLNAYRQIQSFASSEMLDFTMIKEWLAIEQKAVLAMNHIDTPADLARKTFASKQLATQPQD